MQRNASGILRRTAGMLLLCGCGLAVSAAPQDA